MNTNKKIFLVILFIVFTIIYLDLFQEQKNTIIVKETGIIKTFFCKIDNCEHQLIMITNNSKTLMCAFYDITNEKIINHLKKENAEIITHNNKKFEKINTNGLMHHKFCVINNTHVITGSYNPTQINKHHENLILIESSTIANNYINEFEQLRKINEDKQNKKEKTKLNEIIFNNYTLENYFCPQDECKQQIIQKIKSANQTINFMLFTFTDRDIAQEIVKKHKEGIEVKGIIENFQNKKYWQVPLLAENNITIKIHSAKELQHNKIFIIDNTIITGSYNPTNAANTINDENILIMRQPEIVMEYKEYFLHVYDEIK
jgi:phosphatidylserine/phosphatidylglycerophosphate/cardiolipin synthase-like enzyme